MISDIDTSHLDNLPTINVWPEFDMAAMGRAWVKMFAGYSKEDISARTSHPVAMTVIHFDELAGSRTIGTPPKKRTRGPNKMRPRF